MNEVLLSFLLGLIQGLTEFLPISSSAHLLFPALLFGTDDLGLAFDIAVHGGTLLAVIYFFRTEIKLMIKSLISRNNNFNDNRKLAYLLIIATIPIVIAGLLGTDFIKSNIEILTFRQGAGANIRNTIRILKNNNIRDFIKNYNISVIGEFLYPQIIQQQHLKTLDLFCLDMKRFRRS